MYRTVLDKTTDKHTKVGAKMFRHYRVITFLQCVSIACYEEHCISHSKSVCLSVCHTLALSQNDSSYDHGVFTEGYPHD